MALECNDRTGSVRRGCLPRRDKPPQPYVDNTDLPGDALKQGETLPETFVFPRRIAGIARIKLR